MRVFRLCAACLLFSTPARAQAGPVASLPLDVRLGVSHAALAGGNEGSEVYGAGPRLGLSAGVGTRVPLGGGVSFRPEVGYSMRGATRVPGAGAGRATAVADYLDLALPFARSVSSRRSHESTTRVAGYIGPAFGVRVRAAGPAPSLLQKTNANLLLGGAVEGRRLGLDVRYMFQITRRFDAEVRVISVSALYRLRG